jgi:hypothetical protein
MSPPPCAAVCANQTIRTSVIPLSSPAPLLQQSVLRCSPPSPNTRERS